MKIILLSLALVAVSLAMPVAENAADLLALPSTAEIKSAELPQADAAPAIPAEKPAKVNEPVLEEKPSPVPELKADVAAAIKPEVTPEQNDAVSETKPDVAPEVKSDIAKSEISKSPTAELKPEPVVEAKAPELPQLKSVPVEEVKAEKLVPELKPEPIAQIKSEPIVEVKREAIPEAKTEEQTLKLKETELKPEEKKSDDSQAKAIEITKETGDIIKTANEMAGIADDVVDPAAIIPQQTDAPVSGKSAAPIPEIPKLNPKSDKKEPAAAIAPIIPEESIKPAEPKSVPIESGKAVATPVPSSDITPSAPIDPKLAEPSDDSLRVIRDLVNDNKPKSLESSVADIKPVDNVKPVETAPIVAAEEKPIIEGKSENPVPVIEPVKSEVPIKTEEIGNAEKSIKSDIPKEPKPEAQKSEGSQETDSEENSAESPEQKTSKDSSEESSENVDKPKPKTNV